jgi:hypothetical protein
MTSGECNARDWNSKPKKETTNENKIMQGTEKETKTEDKDYRKKTDKQKKKNWQTKR